MNELAYTAEDVLIDGGTRVNPECSLADMLLEVFFTDNCPPKAGLAELIRRNATDDLSLATAALSSDVPLTADAIHTIHRAKTWLALADDIEARLLGSKDELDRELEVGKIQPPIAEPKREPHDDGSRNPWSILRDLEAIVWEARNYVDLMMINALDSDSDCRESSGTRKLINDQYLHAVGDFQAVNNYLEEMRDWLRDNGVLSRETLEGRAMIERGRQIREAAQ